MARDQLCFPVHSEKYALRLPGDVGHEVLRLMWPPHYLCTNARKKDFAPVTRLFFRMHLQKIALPFSLFSHPLSPYEITRNVAQEPAARPSKGADTGAHGGGGEGSENGHPSPPTSQSNFLPAR